MQKIHSWWFVSLLNIYEKNKHSKIKSIDTYINNNQLFMILILTFSSPISSKIIQILDTRFETFSHLPSLWRHLYHLHETSKLFRSYDNSYDCFSRGIEKEIVSYPFHSSNTRLQKVPFTRLELYVTAWNDEWRPYKKGWKGRVTRSSRVVDGFIRV